MKIRIMELRKSKGWTQDELAQRAGVSRPYLAQIETGARNLSLRHQKAIADALGCKPEDLVDFDVDEKDEETVLEAFRSMSSDQRELWVLLSQAVLKQKMNTPIE